MKVRASLGALLRVKRHHGHWQITGECSIAGCCVLLSLGSSVTGHGLLGGRRKQERGGVTPPMDDDHSGAPAKPAAGPVLLLRSLGIPLLHSQLHSNNITALTEHVVDRSCGQERDFPTWIHYSSVSLSFHLLAIALCWRLCIFAEINLAAWGLFWLNVEKFIATNATHRCSVSVMSQCRALQRLHWSDMLRERETKRTLITFPCVSPCRTFLRQPGLSIPSSWL